MLYFPTFDISFSEDRNINLLTLNSANEYVNKAIDKAELMKVCVNIAIVDNAGHLILFKRMDSALLGAIDIAISKAKTSALFQKPCHLLGEKSQPMGPLYGIEHSNGGLITFAGGLPITAKGKVLGAIGVSGSTIENDLTIAQAALVQ